MNKVTYILLFVVITGAYHLLINYIEQQEILELNNRYSLVNVVKVNGYKKYGCAVEEPIHKWATALFRDDLYRNDYLFFSRIIKYNLKVCVKIEYNDSVDELIAQKYKSCIREILNNRMGLLDLETPNALNSSSGMLQGTPALIKFIESHTGRGKHLIKTSISFIK
jgi:hypothetical protein